MRDLEAPNRDPLPDEVLVVYLTVRRGNVPVALRMTPISERKWAQEESKSDGGKAVQLASVIRVNRYDA